jgi:hypothetical protein
MAKKARQRISYGLFPPFPLFVCIGYLDLCYHNKPRKCHESHGMWMRDPLKYLFIIPSRAYNRLLCPSQSHTYFTHAPGLLTQ